MPDNVTVLKKINIKKFRGLKNVSIDFGNRITVVCGKNGTSKSTILGIAAQVFSFRADYTKSPVAVLNYKTLTNSNFKSRFQEHFRLSEEHDKPGSMDTEIILYDGAEKTELTVTLALYESKDRAKARPIVRGNTRTNGASSSRNVTHPVIYLSLQRLLPIPLRGEYKERDVEYLRKHQDEFRQLNNRLLNKANISNVVATAGTIDSAVVHGDNYDKESVSAGEDNVGQILQAIFSFRKLAEEYPDYHGGLLLIDEADAGLFPAAQVEFVKILSKEAKKLNLQVVVTSHSPTLIEEVYSLSKKDPKNYKTIYLTDTYGDIAVCENFSWPDIYADLHVTTKVISEGLSVPAVNVYFEDKEGFDFFNSLVTDRNIRKPLNFLKDVTLGCENYKELIKKKIPEFAKKSIIVFDADVTGTDKMKNCVLLPGGLPPDQLLFDYLYKLPANHEFWKNEYGFTKPVFTRVSRPIVDRLNIAEADGVGFSLQDKINAARQRGNQGQEAVRNLFKDFYKSNEVQSVITGKVKYNPFRLWAKQSPSVVENFCATFRKTLAGVLSNGHGVEVSKIAQILK